MRDIDVLKVQEDGRAGTPDPQFFERATQLQRVLSTRDDDLLLLARDRQQQGTLFYGVICSHPQTTSIGRCIRGFEFMAKVCERKDSINQVQYLSL